MKDNFANKIIWFTFVLDILVILTHVNTPALFRGEQFTSIAVPGFFMISGYLFFRNYEPSQTLVKWKSRFKSVVLPYLVWNLLYYLGYLFVSRIEVLSRLTGRYNVSTAPATVFQAVFFYRYNPVFWFVFQLIILFLVSPVIYYVLKNKIIAAFYFAALLAGLYFHIDFKILNMDAALYYSFAAFAAMHLKDYVEETGTVLLSGKGDGSFFSNFTLGIFCIILGSLMFFPAGWTGNTFFLVIQRVLVPAGLWLIVPADKLPDAPAFMHNSFLVYAFHFAIARLIAHTPLDPLVCYVLTPVVVFAFVGFTAKYIKRYLPVLNGYRK